MPPRMPEAPQPVVDVLGVGMTPLEYMLMVMRDEGADPMRRDRMAVAAAPYAHAKPQPETALGKKDQIEIAGRTAERGSDWEKLLN